MTDRVAGCSTGYQCTLREEEIRIGVQPTPEEHALNADAGLGNVHRRVGGAVGVGLVVEGAVVVESVRQGIRPLGLHPGRHSRASRGRVQEGQQLPPVRGAVRRRAVVAVKPATTACAGVVLTPDARVDHTLENLAEGLPIDVGRGDLGHRPAERAATGEWQKHDAVLVAGIARCPRGQGGAGRGWDRETGIVAARGDAD